MAADLLGLDASGIAELARQGVRYSFLSEPRKRVIFSETDAYATGNRSWDTGAEAAAAAAF